jgi:threonine synthase
VYLEALSNGPTLAFKDMAMQLLGNLFEYELARRGAELNILGATSGDTGSAAEYAMRGKKGVRVFMTSPHGRMSPFQQAQMFSLQDANIHNLAIDRRVRRLPGHRQGGVQRPGLQAQVPHRHGQLDQLGAPAGAGRLLLRGLLPGHGRQRHKVSFAVPSGNFGNICAGHVARMMGLPIQTLVLATNENDVLDEFFRTGIYRVRGGRRHHETSSPSMDISKASNFERFVFDLLGRDGATLRQLFGEELGQGPLRPERRHRRSQTQYGFVFRQAARTPTAWPPSATPKSALAHWSTRTRPTA